MSRLKHMLVFLTVFAVILLLSHMYVFTHLVTAFALDNAQRRWVALGVGIMGVATLVSLPLTRMLPRDRAALVSWLAFPWMGILLLLMVSFAIGDMAWFGYRLLPGTIVPQPSMAHRDFTGAALVLALGLSVFAIWNGLRRVAVRPVTVKLRRLPQSFDGLRVVQITDLHIGPMTDGTWLRSIVQSVNRLQPDIVALTGDLVDGAVQDLAPHVAALADLKATYGAYFITGNHEYYSGVEAWCAHVAGLGLRVLRNERVAITNSHGDSFDLAGVDDWHSHQFAGQGADLPKALAGRDPAKALLLLAHQPAAVAEAAAHGVDLQLSGHTHGGQIWPFTYLVYLQQPFAQGLRRYRNSQTQVYTSPGTGFWGPPMRLGTRAEITAITLKAGA